MKLIIIEMKKFIKTAKKECLKTQLQRFKGFWHNLMSHFHKKITYDRIKIEQIDDNVYTFEITYTHYQTKTGNPYISRFSRFLQKCST